MEVILGTFILIFGFFFIVRLLLGRRIYTEAAGHWVYHISRSLLVFPFRIIKYLFSVLGRLLSIIINKNKY